MATKKKPAKPAKKSAKVSSKNDPAFKIPLVPRHFMNALREALKDAPDFSNAYRSHLATKFRAEIAGAAIMFQNQLTAPKPVVPALIEDQFMKIFSLGMMTGLRYAGIGFGYYHKPTGKVLEPLNKIGEPSMEELKETEIPKHFKETVGLYGDWMRNGYKGPKPGVPALPSEVLIAGEIHKHLLKKKYDFEAPVDYDKITEALRDFKHKG